MTATRCIATRLIEACASEAVACFDQDARLKALYSNGKGVWRVHPWPLFPGEAGELPEGCHLRIALTPMTYVTGVGGVNTPAYVATFQFVMNMEALKFKTGDRAWYDDILTLRRWLYAGGTKPNRTGSIADPDFTNEPGQHQFLTVALKSFELHGLSAFPNKRFAVEYDATWETFEDSQGNRI